MESMHLIVCLSLLITLLISLIPATRSLPVYDDGDSYVSVPLSSREHFDDDFFYNYSQEDQQPQPRQPVRRADTSVGDLTNGYYFVDNGSITPVRPSAARRQDIDNSIDNDGLASNVRFTPLVRYKQTKTHRKKLFVPNFFG